MAMLNSVSVFKFQEEQSILMRNNLASFFFFFFSYSSQSKLNAIVFY